MIGKHIQNPKGHSSFRFLNNYITGKTNRDPKEKIAFTDCLNLASTETATMEMEALAFQNKRCGDPVMHLLLSWRENESPTPKQVKEAVEITLSELNLSECQTVYSLHQNTDNMHLHLCVNRIHPETLRAINPAHGWTRRGMEKAARRIEHAQGWQVEDNAWSEIDEQGKAVSKPISSDVVKLPQKLKDMENLTGEKSALRKVQEILKDQLKDAASWEELHDFMRQRGMEYRKKGSGAVILLNDLSLTLKASDVSRNLGLSQLEKRFGKFVVGSADRKSINAGEEIRSLPISEPQPLDAVNDNADWKTYIQERNEYYSARNRSRQELSMAHRKQKEALKERHRGERKAMYEALKKASASKREIVRQRSVLAARHAYEAVGLKETCREQRAVLQKNRANFPSYERWLVDQGLPWEAEEWRHRKSREYLWLESGGGEINLGNEAAGLLGFTMEETKQGLRFFRAGHRKGVASFIDTGRRIRIYDMHDDAILASLQLGAQKWGNVQVHGSNEFKRRCMELAVENGIRVINPELQELKKELEQRRAEAGRRQISAKKARQEGDPQDVRAQPWELKRNWHEMTEWEQLTTEQENLERERKRLKETPEHERLSPEAAEKMLDDATRILADPKLEEYQRKLDEKRSELEAEYSKREKEYQELLKARPIQSLKERMFQSRYEQRLKEWKGQVQEGEERLQEARDMIDQHDAEVSSWEWKGKWFVQRDARKEAQFYNPMAVVVLQEEAKRRAQEQAQKRLEIEAIEKAESERKKIEAAARTAEAEARAKEDTEHERLRADAKAREKQEYRNRLEEERKIMRREAVKLIVNKFDESSLDDSPRRIVEYDSPNLDRDNRLRVGEIVGIVRHDEVPFVYVAQIIRHEGQEYGALFKVDGKISREVKEGSTLSLNMESDGGLSAMTPRELERFLERSRGLSR